MVYGRYNYSFHGGYFMVYKPTYIDIYYGLFIAYRYIRNGIVNGTMVMVYTIWLFNIAMENHHF
jgi:hypothetical protein